MPSRGEEAPRATFSAWKEEQKRTLSSRPWDLRPEEKGFGLAEEGDHLLSHCPEAGPVGVCGLGPRNAVANLCRRELWHVMKLFYCDYRAEVFWGRDAWQAWHGSVKAAVHQQRISMTAFAAPPGLLQVGPCQMLASGALTKSAAVTIRDADFATGTTSHVRHF